MMRRREYVKTKPSLVNEKFLGGDMNITTQALAGAHAVLPVCLNSPLSSAKVVFAMSAACGWAVAWLSYHDNTIIRRCGMARHAS